MPSSAERAADRIADDFAALVAAFGRVTRRAEGRFIGREWREGQADSRERLGVYPAAVERTVAALREWVDGERRHPGEAVELKWLYRDRVAERPDFELAETFFNSVTRRVFGTRGANPEAEFTETVPPTGRFGSWEPAWRGYRGGLAAEDVGRILCDTAPSLPWADLARDTRLAADALARALEGGPPAEAVEVLRMPLFRNKGAYVVGRIRRTGEPPLPLVFALVNDEGGVRVDAVLASEDEASILFGFTRSYLHVDTDRPCALVEFLQSVMPRKPLHELYTALGYYKHGKTELFRHLVRHLEDPAARLEPAEGVPGMVMTVFTLPESGVVFKVIRDRFAQPKETTRRQVMEKYHLVFAHDRVGRLADAQEFRDLHLPRRCFPDALLAELLAEAGETVREEGDRVRVGHVYTERRVRPLDVYLREVDAAAAREAVLDYGQAIRDLAAASLFPGDLLLKNFGVTRHGRVLFYDYDEISLLGECRFRSIPRARHDDDEMSADPWFSVDEGDVFPEEFLPFLVPPGPLRDAFLEAHADLLTVRFWRGMQGSQAAGEIPDFYPYPPARRLRDAG